MFSAFGHEHEIAAPVFSGAVRGQESVEFFVDARQMKVADTEVSAKDRAEIQSTMLGPEVLDAARAGTFHQPGGSRAIRDAGS